MNDDLQIHTPDTAIRHRAPVLRGRRLKFCVTFGGVGVVGALVVLLYMVRNNRSTFLMDYSRFNFTAIQNGSTVHLSSPNGSELLGQTDVKVELSDDIAGRISIDIGLPDGVHRLIAVRGNTTPSKQTTAENSSQQLHSTEEFLQWDPMNVTAEAVSSREEGRSQLHGMWRGILVPVNMSGFSGSRSDRNDTSTYSNTLVDDVNSGGRIVSSNFLTKSQKTGEDQSRLGFGRRLRKLDYGIKNHPHHIPK